MALRVENVSKGTCLGTKVEVADSPLRRIVGLLGTSSLEAESGLLIFPTQAVHTIGMKYPIDVLFLDKKRKVVGLENALKPYRLSRVCWRAQCVIELSAGTIAGTNTALGDVIEWWDADLLEHLTSDQERRV